MTARTVYAIGDVHGEAERLARLYEFIAADAADRREPALIMHLGDIVDRGAQSRRAVELAMSLERTPPPYCAARTLRGNHEQMMLDARSEENTTNAMVHWVLNGGEATLKSYFTANGETQNWREAVDEAHWRWFESLEIIAREGDFVFVHAGIDPQIFPECSADIRLWTRSRKFMQTKKWPKREELRGIVVVHGHTPTDDYAPETEAQRVNVDTGAVYGGPLTCAVLKAGEAVRFLSVPA